MSKPVAVLISDVHYSLPALKLADAAVRMAIETANSLNVPLIVAGDLHDTKANLRGECVNAMVKTFQLMRCTTYIIIGNHDLINEKAKDHSLNFLEPYVYLVSAPTPFELKNHVMLLPYFADKEEAKKALKKYGPNYKTLIMHQGIEGSNSGDYIQDKSAVTYEDAAGCRVVSGHYHTRQTIQLPDGGQWDYIGNPYTLNFAEANDPPKGYQVLFDDGSLQFVPTDLRKHVVIETQVDDLIAIPYTHSPGDLLKFKLSGTKEELLSITKQQIADNYDIKEAFKLELITTDAPVATLQAKGLTQAETLDSLIDSMADTSVERKERLKGLWKDLCF